MLNERNNMCTIVVYILYKIYALHTFAYFNIQIIPYSNI